MLRDLFTELQSGGDSHWTWRDAQIYSDTLPWGHGQDILRVMRCRGPHHHCLWALFKTIEGSNSSAYSASFSIPYKLIVLNAFRSQTYCWFLSRSMLNFLPLTMTALFLRPFAQMTDWIFSRHLWSTGHWCDRDCMLIFPEVFACMARSPCVTSNTNGSSWHDCRTARYPLGTLEWSPCAISIVCCINPCRVRKYAIIRCTCLQYQGAQVCNNKLHMSAVSSARTCSNKAHAPAVSRARTCRNKAHTPAVLRWNAWVRVTFPSKACSHPCMWYQPWCLQQRDISITCDHDISPVLPHTIHRHTFAYCGLFVDVNEYVCKMWTTRQCESKRL